MDAVKQGALCGAILVLGACAPAKTPVTATVGDYTLAVTSEPQPLQVGESADIFVALSKAGAPADDCQLRFRQYMPDHEMSEDRVWNTLTATGKGRYRGRGGEYHMGGDWELEFELNCGGEPHKVALPFHLEWPE
ncbi:MAG TPA: hypothetical protein ENJ19_11265 [Gammaproteobacteria bacterium]|nr:hypothetical protein [Gammaproteobacteria bacterium]